MTSSTLQNVNLDDQDTDTPLQGAVRRALRWERLQAEGVSRAEIARREGLNPKRVTQVMKLLKLPRRELSAILTGGGKAARSIASVLRHVQGSH